MRRILTLTAGASLLAGIILAFGGPRTMSPRESSRPVVDTPGARSTGLPPEPSLLPERAGAHAVTLPEGAPSAAAVQYEGPPAEELQALRNHDFTASLRAQDRRTRDHILTADERRTAARARVREALVIRLNARSGDRAPDPHAPVGSTR